MQIRKKTKTMYNTPKRHLWPLSRGHHKCRMKIRFLVSVSTKLKYRHLIEVIEKKRESSSKSKQNNNKLRTHEK